MSARNVNLVVDQGVDFDFTFTIRNNNNSLRISLVTLRIQNQKTSNSDKISWICCIFPDRINGVIKLLW